MITLRDKNQLAEYLEQHNIPKPSRDYSPYEELFNIWEKVPPAETRPVRGTHRRLVSRSVIKQKIRAFMKELENKKFLTSIMPGKAEREGQREESRGWELRVSVLVPLYNTPKRYLKEMLASVQAQTYENWQLCLADGSDAEHSYVERICMGYRQRDSRICYKKLSENSGISGNTNACIQMAQGEYLAFFDHDDILHPSALYECIKIIREKKADFVYTDEMTFLGDNPGNIVVKQYKPDFSPESLRGVNYICHLSVCKKALLDVTGCLDALYDGSQDHDIILKLTSSASRVEHIPKILYFWRMHAESVSLDIGAKEYAISAGQRAVRDQELRLGRRVRVVSNRNCATHYRLTYELVGCPRISLLIAGGEQEKVQRLLAGIYDRTSYENYEVCVAEDIEEALKEATGEYIVFLQANMEIIMKDWIQGLLMYMQWEEIGIVTGRLVTPEGIVREAGYITGLDKEKLVLPIGAGTYYTDSGYMGRMYYAHNVNACSLNGSMVKREALDSFLRELLSYDSGRYRGLALSRYLRQQKKRIVVNPYVVYIQENPETITEEEIKRAKEKLAGGRDPYYNPNLSPDGAWRE